MARKSNAANAVGRYRLGAALGRGGQGDVWAVEDGHSPKAKLVLKAVRGAAGDAVAMLAHEFERLAALDHPALPRVRDLGVLASDLGPLPAGTVYFTADAIDGVPLLEAVAAAPRAERPRLLWSAAIDVASALAHVHAAGLCHCDVTPANVLVSGAGDRARAVLIDLGLSAARGVVGEARGTLAYMAPEALAGVVDARGDLWGLGATLHHAAAGTPPFAAADRGQLVRAILRGAPPRLEDGVAPGVADLVARLLAREPAARPPSALAVFDELVQAAAALPKPGRARPRPAVRPPLVAPTTIGAERAIDELVHALASRAAQAPLVVRGPAGAGAADVVAHAVRRHQLDAAARGEAPVTVVRGDLDAVAAVLAPAASSTKERSGAALAAAVTRAALAARGTATVVDVSGDGRAAALFAALAGEAAGAGLLVVVAEGDVPPAPASARTITLGPVPVHVLATLTSEMLGRAAPPVWLESLARASRGLPALAAAIIGALAARDEDPFDLDPERDADGVSLDELRVRQIAARGPDARAAAEALAAWDGAVAVAVAAETIEAVEPARGAIGAARGLRALLELGLARRTDDPDARPALVMSAGLCAAVHAGMAADRRAAWHAAGAAIGRGRELPPARWAHHLAALPADAAAVAPLCAAADELLARGQPARARRLAEAAARVPGPAATAAALLGARAAIVAGEYAAAVALARRAVADADEPAARLLLARAHQRAGDSDAASDVLASLAAARPADADVIGAYARLLVARGRYADAVAATAGVAAAASTGALPRTAGGALCAEAEGTARLYQDDAAGADACFAEALAIATELGDRALVGRARALRGMVAQHRGELAAASAWYRDAAAESRAGGDVHAAAIALLNHGTTLAERGRHGEALPVLATATGALAALGHVSELAAAEIDRGLSLLAVGQVDAASDAARTAAQHADDERTPHLAVFARLLAGDVARRRGEPAAAAELYEEARVLAVRHGLADERHAQRALAALEAPRDPAAAARRLATVAAADATDDDRDRTLLARGRVALAAQATTPAAPAALRALGDELVTLAARARAEDRRDRAWRAGWLAAALADLAGAPDVARTRARAAHGEHVALVAETPAPFRAGLAGDPDAIALNRLAQPSGAGSERAVPLGAEVETLRLRRLLALSRRLHAEPTVDRLLDEVIDTAIELTRAERGFLLLDRARVSLGPTGSSLDGPVGSLDVVVARGFAAGALADPSAISRSIAQRAVDSGEPVVTVDAGVDERFGGAASVAAHRLRSVVAVPLSQRGQVTGCLYVEHRLRSSAFDDDATTLVVELADIAGLAIDNARHADELRRQKAELDALAARLGAEVAEREAELAAVRSRLPRSRDRLGPGLDGIVGTSPEIVAMLDVVVRAARVTSPVVVVGESGTGKELVARALHDAGPRRDRPFVAVNCGAMPEHLLESELFGHVRGAFTGADRDRRGLFEVADGGTLFLDEIADTGPAMQAKLLRVLQDGSLRRVGDDRTRQVDVRIVAATQRSLADLAAAGAFRDDLRYRLEVITVRVPPLRARTADLPLLVEHLLARLAPGKPPSLTRAAWRALAAHGWPGNVRELENALARAVALGGDVIDEDDLPESIVARAAAPAATLAPGADLRLRPALEGLERVYIDAALERAKGNQTVAARLLGLSRFGLQKKLRRAAGGDEEP